MTKKETKIIKSWPKPFPNLNKKLENIGKKQKNGKKPLFTLFGGFGAIFHRSISNNRNRQTDNSKGKIKKSKIANIHAFDLANNKLANQNKNDTANPHTTITESNLSTKKGITTEANDTWPISAQISESRFNRASTESMLNQYSSCDQNLSSNTS